MLHQTDFRFFFMSAKSMLLVDFAHDAIGNILRDFSSDPLKVVGSKLGGDLNRRLSYYLNITVSTPILTSQPCDDTVYLVGKWVPTNKGIDSTLCSSSGS